MRELSVSLTPKQELFVKEYLIDFNATQAAIRAGYSKGSATVIGYENLTKPYIADAIAEEAKKRIEEAEITVSDVLNEYKRIAFLDIRKAFDEQGRLLPIQDMPEDVARAIAGFEVTALGDEDNPVVTSKVKLIDKRGALQDLGKYLKMFIDKVEHTGPDGKDLFDSMSDIERARRIAFALQAGSEETCH